MTGADGGSGVPDAEPEGPRRSPWATAGGTALVCLLGAAVYAILLATDRDCRELPREDLSLAEMGQLRRLVDAYKADPSRPMRLSDRQTSFLLREEFEIPAWVVLRSDGAEVEARFAVDGLCWAVSFSGSVSVDHARMTVLPDRLAIGDLPLEAVLGGARLDFHPEEMPTPAAETLLRHLVSVSRDGDRLLVQVDDPGWLR